MSAPAPRIRILCVDDHRIVRQGLVLILSQQKDFEVVGSAATGEEAIALFHRYHPDVTLMDLQLPRMSGLDAVRAIRQMDPQARIVVLTVYQGDEDIHRALQAGAATYLLKDTIADDLARIIREVFVGRRPMTADVKARLEEAAGHPRLTPREVQVVELIAQAMRNKEIAAALSISELTAQVHVKNVFAKLGVNDRIAAVNVARRRGIIHVKEN